MRWYVLPALIMCGAVAGLAPNAYAQSAPNAPTATQPVTQPAILSLQQVAPPAYASKGLPWGSFRVYPVLGLGAAYDDNVYRRQTGEIGDSFVLENPAFLMQSQWGRHELDLYGNLSAYEYSTYPHEDHTDFTFGGNGRLDILRGIDLTAGASYNNLHEQRGSPDLPGGARAPTQYATTLAYATFNYKPYRFGVQLGATFRHFDYAATDLFGAPQVNNTDRNRDEYEEYAKLSYEFSPGYAFYTGLTYRTVDYNLTFDRDHVRRNNDGYRVEAGLQASVTDLLVGDVFVSYAAQNYNVKLSNISALGFGANLTWTPTPLWTVRFTASRDFNGTILAGASTENDQSVRLTADYQWRENIVLEGYGGYINSKFNGTSRTDDYELLGASLNYYLTHNVSLRLADDFQNRDSSAAGQSYTENTVSIGVNFRL